MGTFVNKIYVAKTFEDRTAGVSKLSASEFNDAVMIFPDCGCGDSFHMRTVDYPIGIMALNEDYKIIDKTVMPARYGTYVTPPNTKTVVEVGMGIYDNFELRSQFRAAEIKDVKEGSNIIDFPHKVNEYKKQKRKDDGREFENIIDKKILDKSKDHMMKKHLKAQANPDLPATKQQPADPQIAADNLQKVEQRSAKSELERVVERYKMIMKLANKDGNKWVDFYNNGDDKDFIVDVKRFTADDWADIAKKLDKVLDDLNSVVIG